MLENYSRTSARYRTRQTQPKGTGSDARTPVHDGLQRAPRARLAQRARGVPSKTGQLPRIGVENAAARDSAPSAGKASVYFATRTSAHSATRASARATSQRLPLRTALVLALAAAIAIGVFGTSLATPADQGSDAAAGGSYASTPRAEWVQGSIPFLYQTDPAWAEAPYAGGTVKENGCGPTCLSMAYIALTGKTDLDPAAMAQFSERQGYVEGDMTSWSLMTQGAAELGLTSEELPADESAVRQALAQGTPIICSVAPGDFTTTGHFIVLAGIADDGGIVVHDPNSAERSARTWDCQRILDQCRNLWALSA